MAYTFVQKGYAIFTGNTVTWQQATGAGNLLVLAFIKANNGASEYVTSVAGNVNTSQTWSTVTGSLNNINSKILTGSGDASFATATLIFLPGANNAGGDTTTTVTVHSDGGGNVLIGAMEFSGIAGTSPFINYNLNSQAAPGNAANAVTSNTVNVSTVPALLAGFGFFDNSGQGSSTTGTGFAGRGLDSATNAYMWGEDRRVTSVGNVAATFTDFTASGDNTLAIGLAFAEPAPPNVADGTSSSSTTVATGTGGAAMPAISVGQFLDVMLLAETSSALTDSGPSDGHNTYFNIRTLDDHANGYIWDHWGCIVTVPLASPVISTTWSGGTPTKAAIAVGIDSGINTAAPFSGINFSGQNKQTSPSGANAQVSGSTPASLVNGTYYKIAGWGFSVNVAAAPAAGTAPLAFTQIGTVWSALGTGACMTYETIDYIGVGSPVQATFTPVTGNTYTFVAAFNNIPLPVFPAGPMPKQIYIMP